MQLEAGAGKKLNNTMQSSLLDCILLIACAAQAVGKKAAAAAKKKTTDIVADTKVQDLPKYPGPAGRGEDDDEEDNEERANMLPAEQHWEREALISTKSAFLTYS